MPYSTPRTADFWLGRAGSGKTYACLDAIAEELKYSPRGEPLILLVPEQATAQMERRLATWPGLAGGFTRARVFSFNHLLHEALTRAGSPAGPAPLSDVGRTMLLRRIMRRAPEVFPFFRATGMLPGTAEAIGKTMDEFQHYGWQPGYLRNWLDGLSAADRAGDPAARKMADLASIWEQYDILRRTLRRAEPADRWRAGVEAISHWNELEGVRIWVDGFVSFTTQERKMLEALMGRAQGVTMALCMDPRVIDAGQQDAALRIDDERLFEAIETTYDALSVRWESMGWKIARREFPDAGQLTRFSQSAELQHLESNVFGRFIPLPFIPELNTDSRSENFPGQPPFTPAIELIEAEDRRAEIESVARRIVQQCRRDEENDSESFSPILWRDVAVLARDLAPYEPLIREIFGSFDIPYFLDRPRRVEAHPLARGVEAALGLIRGKWAGDAALRYVKSGLCGLNHELRASLELQIRASDPRGSKWRKAPEAWMQPIIGLEKALWEGQNPAHAIWRFLEAVRAAETFDRWIAEARVAGDPETAQIHEQAWGAAVAWLDEYGTLAEANPIEFVFKSGDDFGAFLDAMADDCRTALASLQARLIPPTLNQVTIGTVDRSRTPDVCCAFVIGLNEGQFPRQWNPDPLLNDEDRRRLSGTGRLLGPDSLSKRRQERFLAYIALTRASHRLVLSRPLLGAEDKPSDPSPIFTMVRRCFADAPLLSVARAGVGENAALPLRPAEWGLRLGDAADQWKELGLATPLVNWLHAGHPLACHDLPDNDRTALTYAAKACAPAVAARLAPAVAHAYWSARPDLRVTALEKYAECPFRFFAEQMLRLAEPEEADLDRRDLGTLRHRILERVFQDQRSQTGLAWGELDLERAYLTVDATLKDEAQEERLRARLDPSELNRLMVGGLADEMKLCLAALKRAGRDYGLRQIEAEYRFGRNGELTIEAEGIEFALRGTIDRIDSRREAGQTSIVVYDYKSGGRGVNLARMLEGIDLQLPVYALAAQGRDETSSTRAFFYWPLFAAYTGDSSKGNGLETSLEERLLAKAKPSGYFEDALAAGLDASVRPGDQSKTFGFKINKDQSIEKFSRWTRDGLKHVLADTRAKLRDLVRGIASGEIAARPYKMGSDSACTYCVCYPLCRRSESGLISFRRIYPRKKDDYLADRGLVTR